MIHSRISVSMSASLFARAQGVIGVAVAKVNWGNALIPERSIALTRALKSDPAARSGEAAGTLY